MKKFVSAFITATFLSLVSCGTSPRELADESIRLHKQLAECTTEADSTAMFKEIAYVESRARQEFNKQELKEYERMAHSSDIQNENAATE